MRIEPGDAAICLAIITLAKSLNLLIVAEGVDDQSQLAFLQSNDCDVYQGFYYGYPLGAHPAQKLMEHRHIA